MIHKFNIIFCIFLHFNVTQISAYKEIDGILELAMDLTSNEKNGLLSLFNYFQDQYDYITNQTLQITTDESRQQEVLYEYTQNEFQNYFKYLLHEDVTVDMKNNNNDAIKYNKTLPSIVELMGIANFNQTAYDPLERADFESLLQDILNEAQTRTDEILQRALQLESQMYKINKQILIKYIWKALSVIFKKATRISRSAYCIYSHIPKLNASLHDIYKGVDCYTYSKQLVLNTERETLQTVKIIRQNVFSLANIYKKTIIKNTLLGKISTVVLNLPKIARNIMQAYETGINAINKIEDQFLHSILKSISCTQNFVDGVPEMIEIVKDVTTCIKFVDVASNDYDFMKPENERDFIYNKK